MNIRKTNIRITNLTIFSLSRARAIPVKRNTFARRTAKLHGRTFAIAGRWITTGARATAVNYVYNNNINPPWQLSFRIYIWHESSGERIIRPRVAPVIIRAQNWATASFLVFVSACLWPYARVFARGILRPKNKGKGPAVGSYLCLIVLVSMRFSNWPNGFMFVLIGSFFNIFGFMLIEVMFCSIFYFKRIGI